jgi:hypothetical protein
LVRALPRTRKDASSDPPLQSVANGVNRLIARCRRGGIDEKRLTQLRLILSHQSINVTAVRQVLEALLADRHKRHDVRTKTKPVKRWMLAALRRYDIAERRLRLINPSVETIPAATIAAHWEPWASFKRRGRRPVHQARLAELKARLEATGLANVEGEDRIVEVLQLMNIIPGKPERV